MSLPLFSCPACNAKYSLDVVFAHDALREVVQLLFTAHPTGKALLSGLLRYAALFSPPKRDLSLNRLADILREIVPSINAATVSRDGNSYSAPLSYWEQGLKDILQAADGGKLTLPIKSHGYLFEIIKTYSQRGENKAQSHAEREREAKNANQARILNPETLPKQAQAEYQASRAPMPAALKAKLGGKLLKTIL